MVKPAYPKAPRESGNVYGEFIRLTRQYFGNDAPQYVRKLLAVHLQKDPELTTSEELIGLLDWIYGAVAFLEDDQEVIRQYLLDVYRLAE